LLHTLIAIFLEDLETAQEICSGRKHVDDNKITENVLCKLPVQEEPRRASEYGEEAARALTESLRRCLTDEHVVPNTRKALLMLGGHFSFSGDLLAEDWMLKQAGFADDSPATSVASDAAVQVPHVSNTDTSFIQRFL
jgi:hypothetical protein